MTTFDRRTFVGGVATVAASLVSGSACVAAEPQVASPVPAPKPSPSPDKWRGVNLGAWLVLEKWMTPSLFAGLKAGDEYTLSQELGKTKTAALLKKHRDTFITDADFAWIAERGLNAVRLPVGYWIAEENPPYVSGWATVERAFAQAKKHGLGVLLDLHGAPGSQNGMDHSGKSGELGWHKSPENLAQTLRVLENLSARVKGYTNLLGVELLNEPLWDVPMDVLKKFYRDAYPLVRKQIPADKFVVMHDGFRSGDWKTGFGEPDMKNTILDTHLYQCFTEADKKHDMHAHIEIAGLERKRLLDEMQKAMPVIVGEWSCGLPGESLRGLDAFEKRVAERAFGDAQLMSYETSRGWFFWNYKTESEGGWNFRDCVKRGSLPSQFGNV
ncbi:MAG: glycoside hydrolase family 5 protein [Armatimonadetes bacterium]|nr:glycoside hydrolase family 5 protein [Armatimonadota bacterium]